MATVNYLVKGNNNPLTIYLRFKHGRNIDISKSTGYLINPKDWSNKTKSPKQGNIDNQNLSLNLRNLSTAIIEASNKTPKTEINSKWLKFQIESFKNEVILDTDNTGLVTDHVRHIIETANTRKIKGRNKLGLSVNRIKGYNTFLNCFMRYEKFKNSQFKFIDLNKKFVADFTNWLINIEGYSVNYAGKNIDNLKTVALDAKSLNIAVNPYADKIESFKEDSENRSIVTLNFEELEAIKVADLENHKAWENARKWILIGCEIGQRAGDLLSLTPDNLRNELTGVYIDLRQQKTGKEITIKIIDPFILDILQNGFPYSLSTQKLNKNIKKVCEKAGLNQLIQGKKYDKKIKRKKLDFYPKCDLITSHSFRRSFATNFYKKIPTPILINITGHSKEILFREYLNKPEDKDENADLFAKFYEGIIEKRENKNRANQMRVVKTAINN